MHNTRYVLMMALLAQLVASCSSSDDSKTADAAPDLIQPDSVSADEGVIPDLSVSDQPVSPPTDSAPDMAAPDLPAPDLPTPDTAVSDLAAPDTAVPDLAAPDTAVPDLPTPDSAVPDLAAPDSAVPDLPAPDTPAHQDAGPACGGGTVLQTFAPDMVICQGSSVSQCDAAQLCGGWSLCGASQYRARGGETIVPMAEAWLGSCIRNGGSLTAPSDSACLGCTTTGISMRTTSWECDGSDDTATSAVYVGVASHDVCHRVGFNNSSYEAYWIAKPSDYTLPAAVCCK